MPMSVLSHVSSQYIMQQYIQIRIVALDDECSEFVNWESYYQTTIKLLFTNTI